MGILIAGVFVALNIIDKSKLASARNLTKNSPVVSVDSVLWYETSMESSLPQADLGSAVDTWKDNKIGNSLIDATQLNSTDKPIFTNGMNLRSIKFDGLGDNLTFSANNLNNSDYTIIVVEKRSSAGSDNYFIGDKSIDSENHNLLLGYSTNGTVIHSHTGTNSYTSNVSAYSDSPNSIRIFSFTQSSSAGKKTYINGYFAAQSSNKNKLSSLTNLTIGKNYTGEIGEIIIYSKALSKDERGNVEAYLGKKWGVKVADPSSSGATTPCTGIVTGSGCEIACPVSVAGVTSPTSVASGSSGTLTCKTPEYNDSVPYTCSGAGVLNVSGQTCDVCSTNYTYYSGACQGKCTPGSIAGIVSPSQVNAGSASITCNDSANNFSTSDTVSGICNAGTFTLNSGEKCDCASGYILSSGSCVQIAAAYYVLTSGTSYNIPSGAGYSNVKIWAIGGGGGGHGMAGSTVSAAAGGAGGVAYKTWSISGGETISYSIGTAGTGSSGNVNGSNGGNTSATLSGTTIAGNGGKGGVSGASAGGTFSGGDGGSNGGSSPSQSGADTGSPSGGSIGAVTGNSHIGNVGGAGKNSADVSGLFTALSSLGYPVTSGGVGGIGTQPSPVYTAHGGNASGFGCGGGGGGGWGGNGGNGLYGGGGGGGAGEGATALRGGNGGSGVVVIKLY